jgi:hypothetical protein
MDNEDKLAKKFAELDPEWREKVESSGVDAVKGLLVEVQKNEEANQDAKEEDQDLASCKEAYDVAGAGYKEFSKASKLKIRYALRKLKSLGG